MRSKVYTYYAALLMMLLTCVSCREELCYDHYPAMDVRFTWEQEWERDYGADHQTGWSAERHGYAYDDLRPGIPEWVKMVRYYDDGNTLESFIYPEGKRFEVEKNKKFSTLLYNGDTEYIILSDIASLNDVRATATTRTRAGSAIQAMQDLFKVSRTTNPPDVIYAAYLEDVEGVGVHEVRNLQVKMQPLVYTYLITFEFEHGAEYIALARGALGGMAEGVYLRTGVTTEEKSIILFDCDVTSGGCRSQVRSFGVPGFPDSYFGRASTEAKGPFSLNLEVRLTNGKTVEFDTDVTDQIKNQPRGGVIRITGLRIEDDQGGGQQAGGFEVDVTDWGNGADQIEVSLGSFTDS